MVMPRIASQWAQRTLKWRFVTWLTDSKVAFKSRPDDQTLFNFLTTQCRYLSANGLFNCLISNGRWQLAYAGVYCFI